MNPDKLRDVCREIARKCLPPKGRERTEKELRLLLAHAPLWRELLNDALEEEAS